MWLTERGGYLELDFFWWKVFGTKWFNIWWEFSAYLTKRNLLHLHRGWTDEVTQSLNMIYDIICTYCLRARVISQGGSVSANIAIMMQDTYICIYVYRAKSIFILSKFKIGWKFQSEVLFLSACLPSRTLLHRGRTLHRCPYREFASEEIMSMSPLKLISKGLCDTTCIPNGNHVLPIDDHMIFLTGANEIEPKITELHKGRPSK